jgi:predicted kinase
VIDGQSRRRAGGLYQQRDTSGHRANDLCKQALAPYKLGVKAQIYRPRGVASRGTNMSTITHMVVGSDQTRLIVLRGNSGSGKSTVATALREACGRGIAWVSQDLIRRIVLREKDRPGGVNIGLIDQVARYSLDNGYHVILDGIFYADRYEPMLAALSHDHQGVSRFYYLDVSIEETLCRHLTRPQAAEFGADDMRTWYRAGDLLTGVREHVIPQTSSLDDTIGLILAQTQLLTHRAEPAAP